jgi:hypothetical protein
MDPICSHLQIVERIIPSMGATLNDAISDMKMFVVSGMERTERGTVASMDQKC